jgi:hypothetical protein
MSPEFFEKWEHIIQDVEKTKIPVEFIKKLIIKLGGRRQRSINVQQLLSQGLEPDEIEQAISEKLEEYDADTISIEFVLNIEGIAEIVQPETDNLLKGL